MNNLRLFIYYLKCDDESLIRIRNKIKRICKFASRFCKVSCALQGVLGIILILQGIAKKKLQRF